MVKLKLLSVFRTATTSRRRRLSWHSIAADHAQFCSHAFPQYFPHGTLFACIELVAMLNCYRVCVRVIWTIQKCSFLLLSDFNPTFKGK